MAHPVTFKEDRRAAAAAVQRQQSMATAASPAQTITRLKYSNGVQNRESAARRGITLRCACVFFRRARSVGKVLGQLAIVLP